MAATNAKAAQTASTLRLLVMLMMATSPRCKSPDQFSRDFSRRNGFRLCNAMADARDSS
jgi:hypothetical protein